MLVCMRYRFKSCPSGVTMSKEADDSSSVGSALGTIFGNLLQLQLLSNKEFVSSVKSMHLSNLKVQINSLQSIMRLQSNNHSADARYNKTLIFEGQRITPQVRKHLFEICSTADNYDAITPSMKRLVWWLLVSNPYVEDVVPPAPPKQERVKPMTIYKVAMLLCVLIIGYFALSVSTSVLLPMSAMLISTHKASYKWLMQVHSVNEWAWLEHITNVRYAGIDD